MNKPRSDELSSIEIEELNAFGSHVMMALSLAPDTIQENRRRKRLPQRESRENDNFGEQISELFNFKFE